MMSVQESDIGWAWFTFFFVFHTITAAGTAAVSTQLYDNSAAPLLFFFWLFAFGAIICFCFFLASLFSKAARATLISILVFFIGYFLTLVIKYRTSSLGAIAMVSLHPVGAFAFGLQEIGRLEDAGVGLTVSSMTETDSPNGYSFRNTLQNLVFDMIFWGIVGWYSNRVSSGDYGQSLPWYFPFTLAYWCPGSISSPPTDNSAIEYPADVPVEPVSSGLNEQGAQGKGIEIRKLTKIFGEKTAVDNLQMNLYSGQITALLGHNGAGTFCSCIENCHRSKCWNVSLQILSCKFRKNHYDFHADWNASPNFWLCYCWWKRYPNGNGRNQTRDWYLFAA